MIKYENKEIDGQKYICGQMPGLAANRLFIQLASVFTGPALGLLSGATPDTVVDSDDLSHLASVLFSNLPESKAEDMLVSLLRVVRAEGHEGNLGDTFDKYFHGGNLMLAYKLWTWALQVNYTDFLDVARSSQGLMGGLAEALQPKVQ